MACKTTRPAPAPAAWVAFPLEAWRKKGHHGAMPALPPPALSMPQLFTHTFDIDAILQALCGDGTHFMWHLNTRENTLVPTTKRQTGSHDFTLDTLPTEWLHTLPQHENFALLSPSQQAEVSALLQHIHAPHQLPGHFGAGFAGGWLREQAKQEALNWLDSHGLIPPSMRHVRV